MRKNTYFLSSVVLMVLLNELVMGQSLTLSNVQTVVKGFADQATMESTALVTNNTGSAISVKVQRNIIYEVPASANNFCWGPTCYPDFVSQSPSPAVINGGATESSFKADYTPNNTVGKTTIEYVFFDENNPADSVAYKVRFITLPPPQLGGSTTYCSNDSTSLDAGAGYDSYLWSNGATTQSIWVSAPGLFSCDVTIDTVTRSSNTVNISAANVLTPVIVGDSVFCSGDAVMLDAGSGYASYLWNDNSTNQTLSVSSGGTYSVTITTQQGCTGSASMGVSSLNNPATPTINWNGTVLSSSSYSGYQWGYEGFMLYGETNSTITPSVNGTWELWVFDGNGCSAYDSIVVNNVGIDASKMAEYIMMFPNPARDFLHVSADPGALITVVDASGRLVYRQATKQVLNIIPVSGWSEGLYNILLTRGNQQISGKLVIRH